ncbi:MAG: hypothetical protein P8N73_02520 [Pseudomonadales bacterium]|jgi:putative transposase|nr:hypothetical protein [Pseudomonadales bacterium]
MTVPMAVNQRWSMGFVTDQLSDGCQFKILDIMGEYSREVVGQLVSASISGQRVGQLLDQVAETCPSVGGPDSNRHNISIGGF